MRLFVALELEAATAEAIDLAIASLKAAEPNLAWVPVHELHLTMKFLGDADDARMAKLAAAAETVAMKHRPFEMFLEGIGAFPNLRRPRVVWLRVEGEPRLELLHHDLELVCAELGYEVEGRPFRPHITLARVREVLPVQRMRSFARLARAVAFSATQSVDRLTLFDSTSGPAGARYRRIHAARLGGR